MLKQTLIIGCALLALGACKPGNKKGADKESSSTTTVTSEKKAQEIIAYTNAVIDFCNKHSDYLKDLSKYYQQSSEAYKKLTPFAFSGLHIASPPVFYDTALPNYVDPAKPLSYLSEEDKNYFKLHMSDITKYLADLKSYNEAIESYRHAENYKDDKGVKGLSISDSALALLDTIYGIRSMLYDRADVVGESAEKILLEKDPFKDNILAMKEDMGLTKKFLNTLENNSKDLKSVVPALDQIISAMSANIETHKAIKPKQQVKDTYYKSFYDRMVEFRDDATKLTRIIKEKGTITPSDYNSINSDMESIIRNYNDFVK